MTLFSLPSVGGPADLRPTPSYPNFPPSTTTTTTTRTTWWWKPRPTTRPTTTARPWWQSTRSTFLSSSTTTAPPAPRPPPPTASSDGSCRNSQTSGVPGDCSSFRQCLNDQWVVLSCAPGLHWNDRLDICDWPDRAKCSSEYCRALDTSFHRT